MPRNSGAAQTREGQALTVENKIVCNSPKAINRESNAVGLLTLGIDDPGVAARKDHDVPSVRVAHGSTRSAHARLEISKPADAALWSEFHDHSLTTDAS